MQVTRRSQAIGLATLSGALYALAQAPAALWGFAFACLVPLLLALRGRSAGERVLLGWLAGAVAALCATGSTGSAVSAYFGLAPWLGWTLAWCAAQLVAGSAFALFAGLAGDPEGSSAAPAIVRACAAFAVAELVRARLFTGGGWLLLGHALAPVPELAQLAAAGGTVLVSAWLVLANAALGEALAGRGRAALGALACVALLGAASYASMPPSGALHAHSKAVPPAPGVLRVALVQSGVPNAWARQPHKLPAVLGELVAWSRLAGEAELVVWPENAFPVALPANAVRLQAARRALPGAGYLLVGAPRFDRERPERRYTSALLLDRAGRPRARHDKQRLLPFTESWPPLLAAFDPGGAGLSAGSASTPLPVGGTKIGVLICYELLFADLASAPVREGAGLLVNLSNDSWFGDSGGGEQQLAAAVLRAIELRRPLLRATTTGITAAIDSAGRVVARLPRHGAGVLRLAVRPGREHSGYAELGDAGLAALLVLAFGSLAHAAPRRRGKCPAASGQTPHSSSAPGAPGSDGEPPTLASRLLFSRATRHDRASA